MLQMGMPKGQTPSKPSKKAAMVPHGPACNTACDASEHGPRQLAEAGWHLRGELRASVHDDSPQVAGGSHAADVQAVRAALVHVHVQARGGHVVVVPVAGGGQVWKHALLDEVHHNDTDGKGDDTDGKGDDTDGKGKARLV